MSHTVPTVRKSQFYVEMGKVPCSVNTVLSMTKGQTSDKPDRPWGTFCGILSQLQIFTLLSPRNTFQGEMFALLATGSDHSQKAAAQALILVHSRLTVGPTFLLVMKKNLYMKVLI
jgi:hypothetical protein